MNIITSVRVDSDVYEKIRRYSEIEGKTATDFINDFLSTALEQYEIKRSGGAVMTLPNPQNYLIDKDKAATALDMLSGAAREFNSLCSNIPIPLYRMLSFYQQRLFFDSSEQIERFKNNLVLDSTQSGSVANNKK